MTTTKECDYDTSFRFRLWKGIMSRIHENLEEKDFKVPSSVERKKHLYNYRKTRRKRMPVYYRIFCKDTLPAETCSGHGYSYGNKSNSSTEDDSNSTANTSGDSNRENGSNSTTGNTTGNTATGGDTTGGTTTGGTTTGGTTTAAQPVVLQVVQPVVQPAVLQVVQPAAIQPVAQPAVLHLSNI